MKNIVLIGMMGCGKTTIGTLLAQRLNRSLIDTDQWIVEREGRSINDIFATEGEEYFRRLEQMAAQELAQKQDLVLACGGGLPLHEGSMQPLKETGTVIWLCRDPGETYDGMDTSERPLAQNGRADFLARYAQREEIYRCWSDYVISDFSSPENTMNQILEAIS